MRKVLFASLCGLIMFLAFTTVLAQQPAATEYMGYINNSMAIHMKLAITESQVTGSYYYDQYGIPITLKGTVDKKGHLLFKEFDEKGQVLGSFDAILGKREIRGIWAKYDGSRMLPFYVELKEPESKNPWEGEWNSDDNTQYAGSTLTIFSVTSANFDFNLYTFNGGSVGTIEGTAVFTGRNEAKWEDEDKEFFGGKATFTVSGRRLSLSLENGERYAGMGASFDSEYHKSLPRERQLTLKERGVVATTSQESALIKLVGRDRYYDFLFAFQGVGVLWDDEDLDGLGATVRSGSVRGLAPYCGAIIMADPKGRIWAAVKEDDGVEYFTNDPAYAKKLPKTIAKWREERFPESQVIFMNALK